eukprot:scaffold3808_cov112-Isochrysis_galbana.AAC.2
MGSEGWRDRLGGDVCHRPGNARRACVAGQRDDEPRAPRARRQRRQNPARAARGDRARPPRPETVGREPAHRAERRSGRMEVLPGARHKLVSPATQRAI